MNRPALMLLVVALAVPACKRRDPKPSARVPADAAPADARPIADLAHPREGARVAAGSLLAPTIEVAFAVLLPEPPTEKTLAAISRAAVALGFTIDGEPPGRWLTLDATTPANAGYAPPATDLLIRVAPDDEARLAQVTGAIVLEAGGPTAELDAIHAGVIELARAAAITGRGWVLDAQTAFVFDVATLDAGPARSARNAVELIAFLHAEALDDDGLRATETIGMPRFGLPELRLRGVATSLQDQLGDAIDATAQTLIAQGGLIEDGVLEVDVAKLPELAEVAAACQRDHGTGKLRWQVTWGEVEEGTTPTLELTAIGPGDASHRLGAAIDAFYGIGNRESVEVDPEAPGLIAAAERARVELQALRDRLDRGVPEGETISVLAPFPLDDGGEYYLWVDVTRWTGQRSLTGVIVESPPPGAHLDLGQTVDVSIGRILDYVHVRADGTEVGNLTAEVFGDD